MHPRNPYLKNKPNFEKLAQKYPFLRPFVSKNHQGKSYLDFKQEGAVRALTLAILEEDFGLRISMPINCLVPAITQRINYILWIEDIFKEPVEPLSGLDIGTGASGVFAILCSRKNKWNMLGTDISADTIECAQNNVTRNNLEELVQMKLTKSDSFFEDLDGFYDFSMCNPPFFSSNEELDFSYNSRKLDRAPPSSTKTGSTKELIAEGGEISFLTKMIEESAKFSTTVRIFTTMVGVKSHLKHLVEIVKKVGAVMHSTTTFTQGKTSRWGLAWTFDSDAGSLLKETQQKQHKPIINEFQCDCTLPNFIATIKSMLISLEIELSSDSNGNFTVTAYKNTWIHQRRKRRAEQMNSLKAKGESTVGNASFQQSSKLNDNDSIVKRKEEVLIQFSMNITENSNVKVIKSIFIKGHDTRAVDLIHQIFQYLKNKLLSHECNF